MAVWAELRRQVFERAGNHCEYCGLAQAGQEAAFHVDHVMPVSAGGSTSLENLALACVSSSLRKGARRVAPDPQTGEVVALFNPRRDGGRAHFRWEGVQVVGLTPTGHATATALRLNRALAWAIRAEEAHRGRHPPPGHEVRGGGPKARNFAALLGQGIKASIEPFREGHESSQRRKDE